MLDTSAFDPSHYVLIIKCPDTRGIVAAVSGYLNDNDISIVESNQFNDAHRSEDRGDMFYVRVVFKQAGPKTPPMETLRDGFKPIAHRFSMDWQVFNLSHKPRVLIAVSKFGHCLYELLHRWKAGLLPVEITGVMSNHEDMRSFVEWNDIPFVYLPVNKQNKDEQESAFLSLIDRHQADLVVLARYMQILSDDLARRLQGRCINIHHSFLPSFKGAKPYHQAHARGVKIIGATAHYVTSDLDEGPIIEQDVQRVHHGLTPEQLVVIGRDIESRVLARAVTWHAERRVIINGGKTVVFS
ncbi:formyltetrahydrofolate deformylase [Asticcacaulis biprosthecium C19]|uniref:Formyltetrahydrofolate deformylase n=1 Tax=Asticcacaulis biprosthecium C19 TaxID=715226 RepID=F4QJL7_9CAUL|nr:formyltetrahydrofolate deformylase [Asticcacaulis biprosthecium]EGF91968.1 formyltetrahydrofolate deformylase [Asticcacaulis biprosthecium C19]